MPTVIDVARKALVTPGTVSNVITGKRPVSVGTRARVLAAMEELDYRPNLLARGLVQQRTQTIALLIPNITNPFYPEVAEEVERMVKAQGYHLFLVCHTLDAAVERDHLDALIGRMVDGLLIVPGTANLADVKDRLPVVLLLSEESQSAESLPTVAIDFRHAGELAARHLLDLGHRRVAAVPELPFHASRLEGFRTTLAAAGVTLADECVRVGASTVESGYRAAADLLALPQRPTAVFATNDLMALGVMEAAADVGLRVPRDLSIVGLDDIMLGAHVRPSLTTIAVPKRQLAAEATDLLLRHIEEGLRSPPPVVVRPHLVVRRSTAPVRVDATDATDKPLTA